MCMYVRAGVHLALWIDALLPLETQRVGSDIFVFVLRIKSSVHFAVLTIQQVFFLCLQMYSARIPSLFCGFLEQIQLDQ